MLNAIIFCSLSFIFCEAPKIDPETKSLKISEYIRVEAIKHEIDPVLALRIANCESSLNPKAKNPYSSAGGVYQFLDGTWNAYCSGNKFNYKDSVDCFMDLYPKHQSWWVCQ